MPVVRHLTGGADRDRTDDLMLAKHALSQLSYGPVVWVSRVGSFMAYQPKLRGTASLLRSVGWWAWEDLNFRPHAYQARALTS